MYGTFLCICRRFGFLTFLRELFDAPDEVMSYLCHQYRVNDVPVGNDQTKAMIKTVRSFFIISTLLGLFFRFVKIFTSNFIYVVSPQVVEEPYLKVFYTTDERYTVKRSLYSNQISTSNNVIHPAQYLAITVDAEEKQQLEQEMKVRNS